MNSPPGLVDGEGQHLIWCGVWRVRERLGVRLSARMWKYILNKRRVLVK